jgi:hsdS protein
MNNAKNTTLFPYLERLLEGEAVEWKTLGEVAEIGTGSSNRQDESENGLYPFYVRSKNILRSSTYQFDEIAIIIPGEGGVGDIFHYAEGKYALHQRAYRIKVNTENELFPKFLFYYMTKAFKPFILARCVGATATSIRKPMLADFPIPVPPLRIQARIVEILDKFTQLEKELEAELEARKKQYAHYRDQLLNFSQCPPLNVNTKWKTLGEICDIIKAHTKLKTIDYKTIGKTPIIDQGAHYIAGYTDKDIPIIPQGEYILFGDHTECIKYVNFEFVQGADGLKILQTPKDLAKYIYYAFSNFYRKSASYKRHWSQAKETPIPIPPLSEQRRIVDILDRFDTLTNSISEGLPKEIALRRKQYEYYRDALLNFPRAEITA